MSNSEKQFLLDLDGKSYKIILNKKSVKFYYNAKDVDNRNYWYNIGDLDATNKVKYVNDIITRLMLFLLNKL